MDAGMQQLIKHVSAIEEVADDILADKQHLVDLDRKRNKTREAVRILSKDKESKKTWVCVGNMFIKMPKPTAQKLLDKDFDQIDHQIASLRNGLRPKVQKLRDMENKEDMKGFQLNPLTKAEMKSIDDML
ncbi:p53 and DNA damage-regulated protein 1-like [Lingula anatina]|uniref:P53 and DNA damage-regulated protein 1-like n=1 Tax=Lingula anatina TaxID=7574 RepID=A0A1S3K1P0_LINAN|nr:p53 and DNA damage-regulated protein 1-like [Lingula anatina]|eukprot:XP_013416442.2 p53 and DNA damage-regulated protein 1-like [Lingula anatina]